MEKEMELLVLTINNIDLDNLRIEDNITLLDNYENLYVEVHSKYKLEGKYYELFNNHFKLMSDFRNTSYDKYEEYLISSNFRECKQILKFAERLNNIIEHLSVYRMDKTVKYSVEDLNINGATFEYTNDNKVDLKSKLNEWQNEIWALNKTYKDPVNENDDYLKLKNKIEVIKEIIEEENNASNFATQFVKAINSARGEF